mgnify:FL=1
MRDTNKLNELAGALTLLVEARIIATEYAKSIVSKYLVDEGFIEKRIVEKVEPKPEVK